MVFFRVLQQQWGYMKSLPTTILYARSKIPFFCKYHVLISNLTDRMQMAKIKQIYFIIENKNQVKFNTPVI